MDHLELDGNWQVKCERSNTFKACRDRLQESFSVTTEAQDSIQHPLPSRSSKDLILAIRLIDSESHRRQH